MEKLTPHQTQALQLAHQGSTEGMDFTQLEWHFVDQLPYQRNDNKFIAKVWGKNKIYVDKHFWPDLQTMLSTPEGRRIACHESVHQVQIARWGWNQFMVRYGLGYVFAGFSYRNNALEKEAYAKEYVLLGKFEEALNS
jgi:hypothetical protein